MSASRRLFQLVLYACLVFAAGESSALFIGPEDPERRFDYNDEYFMHVLAYRLPWAWARKRIDTRAGFQGTGGSTTTEDLALFQEAWLDADLSPGGNWRLGFRYLKDETYDLRFQRSEISLDRVFAGPARGQVRVFGEAFGNKEDSDLGLGLYLGDRRRDFLGAELLAVDVAFNAKGPDGSFYDDKPRTWRLLGRFEDADWRVEGQAELDTPLDREDASLGRRLHYRKAGLRARVDRRFAQRRLSLAVLAEQGRIQRFGLPGSTVAPLAVGRGGARVHLEYGDWSEVSRTMNAGLLLHYLYEGSGASPDPARNLSVRRVDLVPYLNLVRPLGEHWTASTELYLTGMFRRARFHALPAKGGHEEKLEAQAGVRFAYEATPQSSLLIGAYLDLDDPRFGGGNIAYAIWF